MQLIELLGEAGERGEGEQLEPVFGALTEALERASVGLAHTVSWQQLLQADTSSDIRRYIVLRPVQDFTRLRPVAAAMNGLRSLIDELELEAESRVRVTGAAVSIFCSN